MRKLQVITSVFLVLAGAFFIRVINAQQPNPFNLTTDLPVAYTLVQSNTVQDKISGELVRQQYARAFDGRGRELQIGTRYGTGSTPVAIFRTIRTQTTMRQIVWLKDREAAGKSAVASFTQFNESTNSRRYPVPETGCLKSSTETVLRKEDLTIGDTVFHTSVVSAKEDTGDITTWRVLDPGYGCLVVKEIQPYVETDKTACGTASCDSIAIHTPVSLVPGNNAELFQAFEYDYGKTEVVGDWKALDQILSDK